MRNGAALIKKGFPVARVDVGGIHPNDSFIILAREF